MKVILFLLVGFCMPSFVGAQSHSLLDDIAFYSDVMVNASQAEHRLRAHENLNQLLYQFFEKKEHFEIDLSKVTNQIQQLELGDYKLYSYMVDLGDQQFKAHGYVFHKNGSHLKLEDVDDSEDLVFEELKNGHWIPGVYYHAIPFAHEKDSAYLLFSYMQLDQFTKRKSIDVFSENDGFYFGKNVFKFPVEESRPIVKTRELYFYSADVVMSIQHEPGTELIIIDHLMQVKNRMPGQGVTQVPDGSYEALQLEGNMWVHIDKLFEIDTTIPEPDMESEENQKPKKNIFGEKMK